MRQKKFLCLMMNLGLMGVIPHQALAPQARGLFAPPGWQAGTGGGGDAEQKPEPFGSPEDVIEAMKSGNRPTRERAGEIERLISGDKKKEWMAVFGPDGMRTFRGGKAERNTAIPKHLLPVFEGSTVIHNHPSGDLEPSALDLELVRKHGAEKLVIVGPDGNRREVTKKEAMRMVLEGKR